ncbi:nuclear pore complex protein An-Nup82 [Plectosphaerella cucumerina]|uniref:Nuclear pore complex protein An-Nup82 n=1 Tax=Plectosphaerella cucumerina TaxID=40658 RepID=A0A8K0TAP2_9PEZI|nr:nuclear pore complex protein An-Nup82 [Plectosphaerella cucumerina]
MPKIKSYTAPWLAQGPGQRLFAAATEGTPTYGSKKRSLPGPRRTIARRGTEVFVAIGKELRWADLAYLKETWTSREPHRRSISRIKREHSASPFNDEVLPSTEEEAAAQGFRAIKIPVADDIRQLVMSPNSDFLAILTTHTVHVCILPDPSHLTSEDSGPLKSKTWTLGPTTHVTSRSAVASAIWHPLGVNGSCLVTVTADAIVRVWELSLENRWSFDTPSLSVDLKKLADGTALDQDFSASTSINNTNFSPDTFEMEVAAACFAERGSDGWSPMTLWVAMTEGDVYALCPLLPAKWAPPSTLIPSLSVSIVSKVAAIEDDPEISEYTKLLAQQQLEWMGDLDKQDPHTIDPGLGEPLLEVFNRPSRPGAVPRLQGPFELIADPEGDELDGLLTDIHVIGKKIDADELMTGEDEDLDLSEGDQEGLSLSVVCLLSSSGQVRILLDLEGIEAQWLPPRSKSKMARLAETADPPSLLTFQSIDTMGAAEVTEGSWPMFSTDVLSRYSFFVTHHAGVTFLSLAPWVFRLEGELQGESEAGSDFRLGLLVNGQSSTRERLFTKPSADVSIPLAASTVIRDPDLGYFLLSGTACEPLALTFDTPEDDFTPVREETPFYEEPAAVAQPLDFYEPRPAFQPSHIFDQQSGLPELMNRLKSSRHRALLGQDIRLSPMTLQIFTDAHRVLGDDTYKLGVAVAELFRRCSSLHADLQDQVRKANEVKERIDRVAGNDKDGEGESDEARFQRRIDRAQERQRELADRLERVRKHAAKSAARELSVKERALLEEVRNLEASLLGSSSASSPGKSQNKLSERLAEVTRLRDELAAEVQRVTKQQGEGAEEAGKEVVASPSRGLRIPPGVRKAKLQQVMDMLSRETALVEAVSDRLERLQV